MPLTAEDLASLDPLTAEEAAAITPRMGLLARTGEQAANLPSGAFNQFTRLFYNLGVALPGEGPVEVPKPFDIPPAETPGEKVIDTLSSLTESVPLFMAGGVAGKALGAATGAGKVATGFLKAAGEFGLPGLAESPESAAAGAALGAATEATSFLPAKVRLPLAGAIAAGSAAKEYAHSGDTTNAALASILGVPFLFGRRAPKTEVADDLSTRLRDRQEQPQLDYVPIARPVPRKGVAGLLEEAAPIEAERVRPINELLPPPRGTDFTTEGGPFPTTTARLGEPQAIINPVEFAKGRDFELVTGPNGVLHVAPPASEMPFLPPQFHQLEDRIATLQSHGKIEGPALIDDAGNILAKGKAGVDDHQGLMNKHLGDGNGEAILEAFIKDENHIFLTEKGFKVDRSVGARLAYEADQIPHGIDKLQSGHMIEHAEFQRKLMESKANARPPEPPIPPVAPVAPRPPTPARSPTAPVPPRPPIPAAPPESVGPKAVRYRNRVFTGASHDEAMTKLNKAYPRIKESKRAKDPIDFGYVTAKTKQFVSKQEADALYKGRMQEAIKEPPPAKPVATLQVVPAKDPAKLKATVSSADKNGKVTVTIEGKPYAIVKKNGRWHDANAFDAAQPNNSLLAESKQEAVKALKNEHASSPLSLENEAAKISAPAEVAGAGAAEDVHPLGLYESGDKVLVETGSGLEPAVVVSTGEGVSKVRTNDGYEFDRYDADLKPLGKKRVGPTLDDVERKVGGLEDLADVERQNAHKSTGLKMRRPTGEAGFIPADMALELGRYVAAPVAGAVVGAALADSDHRLYGAAMGAVSVGALAIFGPKVFKILAEANPQIAGAKTIKQGIKQATRDIKGAATGNAAMASKTAKRFQDASGFDKIARWMEKHFVVNELVTRAFGKGYGKIEVMAKVFHRALESVSRMDITDPQRVAMLQFFNGKIDAATFQRTLGSSGTELFNLANTLATSRTALQKIVAEGLYPSALKTKINQSFDQYLTTAYKIFHDPKYKPTDLQIFSVAKQMDAKYGSIENRMDIIHDYLHEIKANRKLFGFGVDGENLSTVLSKKNLKLTPEFKEMLGMYDDPIQQMAVTGNKLITGARTANFFDEIAKSFKPNGLKVAYTGPELDALKTNLRAQQATARGAGDTAKVATLQSSLDSLRDYVWNAENPAHGKLSGQFVDRRVRDSLSTFDSIQTQFHSTVGKAVAGATNIIKYNKILLSPLQFSRQILGLPLLGFMSRTGPESWWKAYQALRDPVQRARLTSIGVAFGDQVQGMLRGDIEAMMKGDLDSMLQNRLLKRGLHNWEEIFRTPDLVIRVASFMKKEEELLGRGEAAHVAENLAIDHMNRYTMNYFAVPRGVKLGRQLPFVNQFLTFAYEASRIAKNIGEDAFVKKDPYAMGTLVAMATYPYLIAKASEQALSEHDRKEWQTLQSLQPDYMRGNFNIVTGKDKNGNFNYWNFTPLVIHDWLIKSAKDIMAGDGKALLADNPIFGWDNTPLLSIVMSQATGRDLHTDQKLNTAGKRFNSFRKEVAPPLLGTDLDRFNDALTPNAQGGLGISDTITGRGVSLDSLLLSYVTSVRGYTQNLDAAKRGAMARAKADMEDLHIDMRKVMRSNARQSYKDERMKSMQQEQKQMLLNLQLLVGQPPE